MPFLFTQPSYFFDYCSAEGDHTYLVTSNHDYEESTWNAVVRDETDDRTILNGVSSSEPLCVLPHLIRQSYRYTAESAEWLLMRYISPPLTLLSHRAF
jgi:hypothetical protein